MYNCRDARTGGPLISQYLADQLALFQPGDADSAQPLLLPPPLQIFSPSGNTELDLGRCDVRKTFATCCKMQQNIYSAFVVYLLSIRIT